VKNIIIVCVVALLALACEEVDTSSQKLTDLEACTEILAEAAMLYAECDGLTVTHDDMVAGARKECQASLCDDVTYTTTNVEVDACINTLDYADNCEDLTVGKDCETIAMFTCQL
jgi:hypothetical protein